MSDHSRGIDHLVLTLRDLDAAEAHFRRLGFTLTPRAHHPFGTSNHLALFDGNFLELVGLTAPERMPPHAPGRFSFAAHTAAFLERRQGLSFLVLSSTDARGDAARLRERGLDCPEPVDFSRAAPQPDGGEATVSFTIAFALDRALGDAPHFLCQLHTPAPFWQPAFQRHANTARAIVETVLLADDPGALAPYYRALLGADAVQPGQGRLEVRTARGRILVLSQALLAARYAGVDLLRPGQRPAIVGLTVAVDDLDAAARCLEGAAVGFAATPRSLRIAPAGAGGAVLELARG